MGLESKNVYYRKHIGAIVLDIFYYENRFLQPFKSLFWNIATMASAMPLAYAIVA
jgi:hypothetical protein